MNEEEIREALWQAFQPVRCRDLKAGDLINVDKGALDEDYKAKDGYFQPTVAFAFVKLPSGQYVRVNDIHLEGDPYSSLTLVIEI